MTAFPIADIHALWPGTSLIAYKRSLAFSNYRQQKAHSMVGFSFKSLAYVFLRRNFKHMSPAPKRKAVPGRGTGSGPGLGLGLGPGLLLNCVAWLMVEPLRLKPAFKTDVSITPQSTDARFWKSARYVEFFRTK